MIKVRYSEDVNLKKFGEGPSAFLADEWESRSKEKHPDDREICLVRNCITISMLSREWDEVINIIQTVQSDLIVANMNKDAEKAGF